jgi:geranyl-CoA carboxylase alpha subunit
MSHTMPGTPRPHGTAFNTLLVANRGEIACRIFRSAKALGLRTVAVYSDADAQALFVQQADLALRIGPAAATQSYLSAEAIIAAAHASGAQAIHPGYGFLSENASFAQAVADAGLVWVGPPPAAIEAMGDKATAKRRMLAAGVPCLPGYLGEAQDDATLAKEAGKLGYPLLVKAVAGGGGRGIRRVDGEGELLPALQAARREAQNAFGDGSLMLEKLIHPARHIEVQVFADAHGHCIHLGERDCSTQRRRQKVIEEAPSPVLNPALREAMGSSAVAAAQAVAYVGAGTVEFVVDAQQRHYFLEMNTRLQVEHPVTEAITGLDLVDWQLRVAAGEPLPLQQNEVQFSGHAIEARLYAEDPAQAWRPQAGPYRGWQGSHPAVRIDHGLAPEGQISPHYDAMVAKFIAHGRTRAEATAKLRAALAATPLWGPANNAGFLHQLLGSPGFEQARLHTTSLDEDAPSTPAVPDIAWRLAAAWFSHTAPGALRSASVQRFRLALRCAGQQRELMAPDAGISGLALAHGQLRAQVDGQWQRYPASTEAARLSIAVDAQVFQLEETSPWPSDTASQDDPLRARAPVAGVLAALKVQSGQQVRAGEPLACVEAMKMELWLHAGSDGHVLAVHAAVGQSVAAGALVVELQAEATAPSDKTTNQTESQT